MKEIVASIISDVVFEGKRSFLMQIVQNNELQIDLRFKPKSHRTIKLL